MPTTNNNQTAASNNPAFDPAYKVALDTRRAVLGAISEDQILRDLRLDTSRTADVAEGSAVKLQPFRAEIAATFGEEKAALVDQLATTARAARQADVELTLAEPSGDMSALAKEVGNVYDTLIADATSLWKRKLIDGSRLEKARDIRGYQALLKSTLVLIALLREQWGKIEGKSLLTREDLDRAEHVAQMLATALAHRDQQVDLVPARDLRERALSMLVHDYEELRRIMLYLRYRHGDADTIVPSLYARRGSSSRTDREEQPTAGEPSNGQPANGQPAPGQPTNGAPVTPPVSDEPPPVPTPGDDDSPFTP